LRHFAIVGKGLEGTLKDLQKHTTSFAPTFIIINDFEKKEVENKACHDLNFGLMTKTKACKGAGQECDPKITFALLGV
jgi:hypothetical protein